MNFCNARLYIDPGCIDSWTNISGRGAAVNWDGGEVASAEQHVFDDDYPKVDTGKPGMVTVTCKAMYSEGAAEATELLRGVYEGGCPRDLCVRWIPLGDTAPNKRYTTLSGILITPVWPQGDAGAADITLIEFKVVCPTVFVDDVV